MVGPYADASTLLQGGYNDLPGLDDGWKTEYLKTDQPYTIYEDGEVFDRVTVKAGSYLRYRPLNNAGSWTNSADQSIGDCGADIRDIFAPVHAGGSVYFEFVVYVQGDGSKNFGMCIHTPPNPTGGFMVKGGSVLGTYKGGSFGADDFNNSAGVISAGLDSTLQSITVGKAKGVLYNGLVPGLLKLQLGPAHEPSSEVPVALSFLGSLTPSSGNTIDIDGPTGRLIIIILHAISDKTSAPTSPAVDVVLSGAGVILLSRIDLALETTVSTETYNQRGEVWIGMKTTSGSETISWDAGGAFSTDGARVFAVDYAAGEDGADPGDPIVQWKHFPSYDEPVVVDFDDPRSETGNPAILLSFAISGSFIAGGLDVNAFDPGGTSPQTTAGGWISFDDGPYTITHDPIVLMDTQYQQYFLVEIQTGHVT